MVIWNSKKCAINLAAGEASFVRN